MRDSADGNVFGLARTRSGFNEILRGTEAATQETKGAADVEGESSDGEALIPLPPPGASYDTAYARPHNKPLATLRFIKGEGIRGFPYANLDSIDWLPSEKPGGGPSIVIRFSGLVPREATISGRNMRTLFDLLSYHRVAWVRELPPGRDFRDGQATVITDITVKRITELPD